VDELEQLRERVFNDATLHARLFAEADREAFVRLVVELAPGVTPDEVRAAISRGRHEAVQQCCR